MPTSNTTKNKTPKGRRLTRNNQKHAGLSATVVLGIISTLPPLVLALVELLKAGHSLGWW
jgi:hypothetical protein